MKGIKRREKGGRNKRDSQLGRQRLSVRLGGRGAGGAAGVLSRYDPSRLFVPADVFMMRPAGWANGFLHYAEGTQ